MLSTTPLQIRNNPSNKSTAKQQWTFSKSNRFPSSKSKYFYHIFLVVTNLFMNIDPNCLKENHHSVWDLGVNTLMEINRYLKLESTNYPQILGCQKMVKVSVSQQTDKT